MAGEFDGRVALVSGVARVGQVGHAVARALGGAGARLVLAGRDAAALGERVRELDGDRVAAAAAAGDLTDPAAARAAVALAETRYGGLDVVINVAGGLTSYGPFLDADATALDRELAINLRTVYCVCQAAVPALRRRGGGAVVNFASIAVLQPQPSLAAYAAAKGAVATLTRALARELFADRIRVNAVAPATLKTASNVAQMGSSEGLVELGVLVGTVLFLASPAAGTITGHVLPVTGPGR